MYLYDFTKTFFSDNKFYLFLRPPEIRGLTDWLRTSITQASFETVQNKPVKDSTYKK